MVKWRVEPKIIFQDKTILVIEKPSGWITNEADTTTNQPVIQSWLKTKFKYSIANSTEFRSGIVHRLDKETSGLLVVAKTKEAFETLQSAFKNRLVKKTYIALLHGKMKEESGSIKAQVGRLPWRRDRFGIVPGGRESVTRYQVLKYIKGERGGYSLVEFYPETGRTHQIRIHSKHIGHAIVADEFYAGRKTSRNDRKFCPRLFLHASKIELEHPKTGLIVGFESKLPDDLQDVLYLFKPEK